LCEKGGLRLERKEGQPAGYDLKYNRGHRQATKGGSGGMTLGGPSKECKNKKERPSKTAKRPRGLGGRGFQKRENAGSMVRRGPSGRQIFQKERGF